MKEKIIEIIEASRLEFWNDAAEIEVPEMTDGEIEYVNKLDDELADSIIKLFNK